MVDATLVERTATLHRVPLFTDLSAAEIQLLAARISSHAYGPGTVLFSEGEICRELLIVQQGSVKVVKTAANGRQQLLGIERAGASLSEVPVFDGGRHPATAEAADTVVVLRLEAGHFRQICAQNPEVAIKVIKVLAHRLRNLGRLIEELSFTTVRGRLMSYLALLASDQGIVTSQGVMFDLLENNEELATRLGTVRELVSRNLGRLHSEGKIVMRRRHVTIPDLAAFRQELSEA